MPMVYIIFRGSRGASTFFPRGGGGGYNFSRGRSNCLFPIESHITCVFPGVRAPCPCPAPPLDQWMQYFDQLDTVTKVRYEKKLSIFIPPPPPWVSLNVNMVSGKTTIMAWPGSKLFFQVLTGLIGVQTVWHFIGYDKLNQCILTLR